MTRCSGHFGYYAQLARAACLLGSIAAPVALAGELSAQRTEAPRVFDSAGVRIIEHRTIRTTRPAFHVSPRPITRIGGLTTRVEDEIAPQGRPLAFRFRDGRVAVAEKFTVRIFDSSGRFVRLVGARGRGPGEFDQQIATICRYRGDEFVVVGGGRRVSRFDAAGNHLQSSTGESGLADTCADDGAMVAIALASNPYAGTDRIGAANSQARWVLRMATNTGRVGDPLGVFNGEIGVIPYKLILDQFVVQLGAGLVFADNGASPEIKAYTRSGSLAQILRWADPLVPVTRGDLERIARTRVVNVNAARERSAQLAQLVASNRRAWFPAYDGFLVDRVGRVWVRDCSQALPADSPTVGYTVFSSSGALLGRFGLAAYGGGRAIVTDAGADYVVIWSASRDEGVQVEVYGIQPRG